MKIKKRKEIQITLILSEEEAMWLKSVMQNPIIHQKGSVESRGNVHMRKLLWNALNEEGI